MTKAKKRTISHPRDNAFMRHWKRSPRFRGSVQKDLDEREKSTERLGTSTDEQRLRWVVDFAQEDLHRLRPEERVARGYDLHHVLPVGSFITIKGGPMSDAALEEIQRQIREQVRKLISEPRRFGEQLDDPNAGWRLPVLSSRILRTSSPGSKKTLFVTIRESDDEEAVILCGVAELIQKAGQRLRACLRCDVPFVAHKRQIYCTTKCSQDERNARKALTRR
jgi:hypothetical protein